MSNPTSLTKHVFVSANQKSTSVDITPTTTARDVIAALGLPGEFCLSIPDKGVAHGTEELYPTVHEGMTLQAAPPSTVAA